MLTMEKMLCPLPEQDDYTMEPCGHLGQDTCVNIVEGVFIGEFSSEGLAKVAAKIDMDTRQRYTNLFRKGSDGSFALIGI